MFAHHLTSLWDDLNDYEQSTFVVERPFVFNGKNENLLKEDDLADRTIRLLVLPIKPFQPGFPR
jgi:hypothetical protein